jgi:hypothetical protein
VTVTTPGIHDTSAMPVPTKLPLLIQHLENLEDRDPEEEYLIRWLRSFLPEEAL